MPVRVFLSLIDENVAFLYHPAGTVRVRVVAGDRLAKMTTVYDACSPHASLGSTVHNREADSSLEPHFDKLSFIRFVSYSLEHCYQTMHFVFVDVLHNIEPSF